MLSGMESAAPARLLQALAIVFAGGVFALFWLFERPGLGIAHGYYIAIILASLASGPRRGALAGALATGLYAIGVFLNPHVPVATLPTFATAIRALTFVSVGLVVGLYATRNRTLADRLAKLADELRTLANRDSLTGLPNTRAFDVAVGSRLEDGEPFALLVGDLDGLTRINATNGYDEGNDTLRRVAETLTKSGPGCDVARIGGDEFAVLLPCKSRQGALELAHRFERELATGDTRITFGWAIFPGDAESALTLYRIADERLYARKLLRGERRGLTSVLPGDAAAV